MVNDFPISKLLVIEQGITWSNTLSWSNTPFANTNMAAFTANAGFQQFYNEGIFIAMPGTVTNTGVSYTLSSNATAGIPPGKYVYQVDVIDPYNNNYRVQEGLLYLKPAIYPGNYVYETPGGGSCGCTGDCTCNVEVIDGGSF